MASSGGGIEELANTALRQSPSTTQFYTHRMCPYAQRVWIALEAGNCPYEMQQIDLYGAGGKPDWFLDLNPEGQVPVLTCFGGAKILIDSEYILTRMAEGVVEGGRSLCGDGSEETADRIDRWRNDINTKVKVVGKQAVLRGGKHVDELVELLQSLDGNVAGPYLCGDSVTTADCSAFPFLWRIDDEFDLEKNGCKNIRAWLDKCSENEAFKKTIQSAWWWWW
jgi:glutathione S-transferase